MSAPGCTVVPREDLTEGRLAEVRRWLSPLGRVSEWRRGGLEIVGPDQAEVYVRPAEPEAAFSSIAGSEEVLGWAPKRIINVSGANSAPAHHAFVGRAALVLAERLDGWIHLGAICVLEERHVELPPEAEERIDRLRAEAPADDRDDPMSMLKYLTRDERLMDAMSRSCDAKIREEAARRPGRFLELADRYSTSYLVDPDYMRHWLKDPGFYID